MRLRRLCLSSRISQLLLLVFFVTNLCFFLSGYDTKPYNQTNENGEEFEIQAQNRHLMGDGDVYKWSVYGPHPLLYRDLLFKSLTKYSNCSQILRNHTWTYVASGWTKAVYSGVYKKKEAALKTVDIFGHDVTMCIQNGETKASCVYKAEQKIAREISLLRKLRHANIVQVSLLCLALFISNRKLHNNIIKMIRPCTLEI